MSLTPDEAAQTLRDATQIQIYSRQIYGYSLSAPYFFTWGAVWMAGYAGDAVAPERADWIWAVVLLAGIATSILIGQAQKKRTTRPDWRLWGALGVIYAFTIALFTILGRATPLQFGAYWPLLTAALYAGVGLWMGARYILIAAVLAAATLGGYFFLRDYFFLWMAVCGGGSLILTGLWMRQA